MNSSNDNLPQTRSTTLLNSEDQPYYFGDAKLPHESWVACAHPRGWLYFRNALHRVVTDQDVRNPQIRALVDQAIAALPLDTLDECMEIHLGISHWHVRADLSSDNHQDRSGGPNLMINHGSCVASYTMEDVLPGNVYLLDPRTLNSCRRSYWNHLWSHPSHTPTPPRALQDASDALAWFFTDNLIGGNQSIIPYSKAECDELYAMVQRLSAPAFDNSTSKTMFLAWFLREVASFRASISWGETTFQERHTAIPLAGALAGVHREAHQESSQIFNFFLNLISNVMLFGIPRVYAVHIKATSEYRGRLAEVQIQWEKYIERVVREYTHFLLISTVLLSATVGFLSIDNITEGAKLAGSISALTSLSSIIIGVFAIWRHQANTSSGNSYIYMNNIRQSVFGIPGHAILLGLPPSLLVWAIVAFTIAVIAYVAQGVNNEDPWSQISAWALVTIAAILLVIVLSALYSVSTIWTCRRWFPFTVRSQIPRLPWNWRNSRRTPPTSPIDV